MESVVTSSNSGAAAVGWCRSVEYMCLCLSVGRQSMDIQERKERWSEGEGCGENTE
jgi:hypothetical protein